MKELKMELSPKTRQYWDNKKFKNKYIKFNNEKPYPNKWTESGLVTLDGVVWKFYSRTKELHNPSWSLVNENDEVISFKSNELDLLFGENGEKFAPYMIESLNEKLEELEQGMYATQSAYDILNLMKNKPKAYRIVFDTNNKYYFIGDAYNYIHQDILEAAYNAAFYPEFYDVGEVRDYIDESMFNGNLLLFAFSPNGDKQLDIEKSSDGYTRKYVYDFGTIYAHELTRLEDFDIYGLLKEPIKKETVLESVDVKKLNEEFAKIFNDNNTHLN